MNYLFAALLSMGITVLLVPPLMAYAGYLKVLDIPGGRKAHAKPIPRVGGIAMAAGMLTATLIWGDKSPALQGYVLGLLVLLGFGIQDDRLALSPTIKLIGQLLAAWLVMQVGGVEIVLIKHVESYDLPRWLSVPLTLTFIVGVTNAINLADGLDGLAGGTTLLCLGGLLLLALTANSMHVVFFCVVTMAAVLGFLRYNTHPARIFMGDAGSQVLGFSVAVFSLILTQDRDLPLSAALPLLLLGVPVIDTLAVMTERVLDGRSPFMADRIHVHHRLLALGMEPYEAVIAIYGMQAVLMVLAWQLRFVSDVVIAAVFCTVAVTIVTLLRLARSHQWRWRSEVDSGNQEASWLQGKLQWWIHESRLQRFCGYVIAIAMVCYALLLIINGIDAPLDIRILSGVASAVVLISIIIHRQGIKASWLERVALYVCVLLAVALDRPGSIPESAKWAIELLLFGCMAVALAIRLYASLNRRLRISPLDVLVLLLAVALPNLPGSIVGNYLSGTLILKVLLLLYCVENLTIASGIQWRILTGGALFFLATVTVRGLI